MPKTDASKANHCFPYFTKIKPDLELFNPDGGYRKDLYGRFQMKSELKTLCNLMKNYYLWILIMMIISIFVNIVMNQVWFI